VNKWRVLVAGTALIALVVLAGCASAPAPTDSGAGSTMPAAEPGDQPVDLAGTSWSCYEFKVSGAPQTVPEDVPITAEFSADGKMSGNSGVNTYSTSYTTSGNGITISDQIVSTKMAGPEEAMTLESNYLLSLPTAVTYNVDEKGDLILLGAADDMVARYRPAQ
jgi:heat shock protein HslJ